MIEKIDRWMHDYQFTEADILLAMNLIELLKKVDTCTGWKEICDREADQDGSHNG